MVIMLTLDSAENPVLGDYRDLPMSCSELAGSLWKVSILRSP